MWLKNINEIAKYIPKDELIHDIQIIGNAIYVDGNHQNPPLQGCIEDFDIINRALTEKEILKKYNKSLHLSAKNCAK